MPVFHKHKLVYYHIPKTGGYSMEKYLGLPALDYKEFNKSFVWGLREGIMTQHQNRKYISQFITAEQSHMYSHITMVRNPWSRAVSAFYYLHPHYMSRFGSFEQWLHNCYKRIKKNKYPVHWHMCPQTRFVYDNAGRTIVDYVGKFESYENTLKHICNVINKPYTVSKKLNVSSRKKKDYREYYNDTTKQMIIDMYPDDIEHFNYSFTN